MEITSSILKNTKRGFKQPEIVALLALSVLPSLQSREVNIYVKGIEALSLYCSLNVASSLSHGVPLLSLFLDKKETRVDAIKGMFDLFLVHGIEQLLPKEEEREEVLLKLTSYLQDTDANVSLSVIQGFAKLLLIGRLKDSRILQCLMILLFHPSTEEDSQIRQTLSVFFSCFSSASYQNKLVVKEMAQPMLMAVIKPVENSMCEVRKKE